MLFSPSSNQVLFYRNQSTHLNCMIVIITVTLKLWTSSGGWRCKDGRGRPLNASPGLSQPFARGELPRCRWLHYFPCLDYVSSRPPGGVPALNFNCSGEDDPDSVVAMAFDKVEMMLIYLST